MHAYWFFVVYVSPVLLVLLCGYLGWRAFLDSRAERSDEMNGAAAPREPGDSAKEREPWTTDPDAWKGEE